MIPDIARRSKYNALAAYCVERDTGEMGLLRSTAILVSAALLTACGNAATVARADPASVACEVAAAYAEIIITEAKDHPVVFTADDHSFSSPIIDNGWWKMIGERPQPAAPPPASLIKRIRDQGNRNAVSRCASVRKLLDSHHIRYGSEAVDAVNTSDPSKAFMASIETISLPVVSADGQRAVLASSGVSGPLAGGGFLQFLERQTDGRWKVSAFSPLWVS